MARPPASFPTKTEVDRQLARNYLKKYLSQHLISKEDYEYHIRLIEDAERKALNEELLHGYNMSEGWNTPSEFSPKEYTVRSVVRATRPIVMPTNQGTYISVGDVVQSTLKVNGEDIVSLISHPVEGKKAIIRCGGEYNGKSYRIGDDMPRENALNALERAAAMAMTKISYDLESIVESTFGKVLETFILEAFSGGIFTSGDIIVPNGNEKVIVTPIAKPREPEPPPLEPKYRTRTIKPVRSIKAKRKIRHVR